MNYFSYHPLSFLAIFMLCLNPDCAVGLLLRLENPCCNSCFPILFLDILMNMSPSQNRSNCTFRFGFLGFATDSTAQSGFKGLILGMCTLQQVQFFYFSDFFWFLSKSTQTSNSFALLIPQGDKIEQNAIRCVFIY